MLMSACSPIVPATIPPQLNHTAGSPLTVIDNRIITEAFTITTPDGWRIVTSVANAPQELVIVSPDDAMVIRVTQVGADCDFVQLTPDATLYTPQYCLGDDIQLRFVGEAPLAQQAHFDDQLSQVMDSVVFR